jgi:hypothetical protein
MSASIHTGLNPFKFIRKHILQICSCLSAQRLSERMVQACNDQKFTVHIFPNISAYLISEKAKYKDFQHPSGPHTSQKHLLVHDRTHC